MDKQTRVFNMYIAYLLWRSSMTSLDLATLVPSLGGVYDLSDPAHRTDVTRRIEEYANANLDADGRAALAERVAATLGCASGDREPRMFTLVRPAELLEMSKAGVDIQLHTHRHCLPEEPAAMAREIADNASSLSAYARTPLVHFCFPSGRYTLEQLPRLTALGIETATTTETGFNYPRTPRLQLRRILDAESLSQLDFEAELSGFFEVFRRRAQQS
jgi:hypothetical protein